jgi:predicted esterase
MAPSIRIPKAEDFKSLEPDLHVALHFPSPPESTTAILILFHGLGDSEAPFAGFAQSINLPGVLGISVRGTSPLPPVLLGLPPGSVPTKNSHWGDDLNIGSSGGLDPDPGFTKATDLVLNRLIREILLQKCGWELSDILLFGYGQGGSLALGLASKLREGPQVEEVKEDEDGKPVETGKAFKGVVSIGGDLPPSMIPSLSARTKSETPVLICRGKSCDTVDDDAVDLLKREFSDVQDVKWNKQDSTMPSSQEEVLPMMKFFADRLRTDAL